MGSSLAAAVANRRLVNQNTEKLVGTERFDTPRPRRHWHLDKSHQRARPERPRDAAEVERAAVILVGCLLDAVEQTSVVFHAGRRHRNDDTLSMAVGSGVH